MPLLSHSARPEHGIQPQTYRDHVGNVVAGAEERVRRMLRHYQPAKGKPDAAAMESIVHQAALGHDIGKLDTGFQETLARNRRSPRHIRHEDAGVAYLAGKADEAAGLISAHHQGLVRYAPETRKDAPGLTGRLDTGAFRIDDEQTRKATADRLAQYVSGHAQEVGAFEIATEQHHCALSGLMRRLLLSCVVDADHFDTAQHYNETANPKPPEPRWAERLEKLKAFVIRLPRPGRNASAEEVERQAIRDELFRLCLGADPNERLRSCDAVVGSGKTTAMMAHLLQVARHRELRHIIVVLPYTNIIKQSVEVYRRALCLEGEKPEEIVAEHHHQAEFSSPDTRHLTSLWQAPVIVTTAVQFFETLASRQPSRLRKLHELPGSAVCLDEAHAALRADLWPVCWKWLIEWTRRWDGHLVLASGSLPEFWRLDDFRAICEGNSAGEPAKNPAITVAPLSAQLRNQSESAEQQRVRFDSVRAGMTSAELMERVESAPGPRLVVVNTIQSAAVLAERLRDRGRNPVLHLSTALTPAHRGIIVERVKALLRHQSNWTLVATSLVEAGMDFSFASGFRQRASAASLIQLGGRVNRNADRGQSCTVLDFDLSELDVFPDNPSLAAGKSALLQLFENGQLGGDEPANLAEVCRAAMQAEFCNKQQTKARDLVCAEWGDNDYPSVAEKCRVIESDTRTVVIDPGLVAKLRRYEKVTQLELVRNSVQLYHSKIERLGIPTVRPDSDLFCLPNGWDYDPDFLGYMVPVVRQLAAAIPGGYFI